MGLPFVYCVICGCPFDIPPREDFYGDEEVDDRWATEDPTEDATKQWLENIRLMGATEHLEDFATASFQMPENNSKTETIFISGPAYWFFQDGCSFSLQGVEFNVLSPAKNGRDMLFALHERCLNIIQRAIEWHVEITPESSWSLVDVYKALCDQYLRNMEELKKLQKTLNYYGDTDYTDYGLEFKHNYYGAREFWRYGGWEQTRLNEWYCNDPIDVPGLALQLLTEIPSEAERPEEQLQSAVSDCLSLLQVSPLSSLEELPLEILRLVVSFLPVQSVLRLRRCSKKLESSIVLDQPFWRTQLLAGCLVPYAWELSVLGKNSQATERATKERLAPLMTSTRLDWKGFAQQLASADDIIGGKTMPAVPASWGFRNRCRIWTLVNHLILSPED